jgi:mRNA interferase MazF
MVNAPYQWKVVHATLDPVRGSEQAGERPVLIVSRESLNRFLSIVSALPLTTRHPGRRIYSTEVLVPAGRAGQPNESIVMAHQIRTIAKERLLRTHGSLDDERLREQVRGAVRLYLDLD